MDNISFETMDQIPIGVRDKLIELDNENRQLQQDKQRLEAQVKCNMEFAAEAEEENEKLRQQITSMGGSDKLLRDLQGKVTSLNKQLEERTAELGSSASRTETLETLLKEAEYRLEHARPVTPSNTTCEEPAPVPEEILEELNRLRNERDNAEFSVEEIRNELLGMTEDRNQLNETLELVREELQDLKNQRQELRDQVQSLETELADARATGPGARRGNSMFGEFVEERVKLEKDLKKLFGENQLLMRETVMLRRQVDEARIEASTRRAPAAPAVCECKAVSEELKLLREKLRNSDESTRLAYLKMIESSRKHAPEKYAREAYDACRFGLDNVTKERDILKLERDSLNDKVWKLEARVTNQEHTERQLKDENEGLARLRLHLTERLEEAEARLANGGKIPDGDTTVSSSSLPFVRPSSGDAAPLPLPKTAEKKIERAGAGVMATPCRPNGDSTKSTNASAVKALDPLSRMAEMQKERRLAKEAKEEKERQARQSLVGGPNPLGGRGVTPLGKRGNEPRGLLHLLPDYMKPPKAAVPAKKVRIEPGKLDVEKMLSSAGSSTGNRILRAPPSPILASQSECSEVPSPAVASSAHERLDQDEDRENTKNDFDYDFDLDRSPFDATNESSRMM